MFSFVAMGCTVGSVASFRQPGVCFRVGPALINTVVRASPRLALRQRLTGDWVQWITSRDHGSLMGVARPCRSAYSREFSSWRIEYDLVNVEARNKSSRSNYGIGSTSKLSEIPPQPRDYVNLCSVSRSEDAFR